MSDIRDFSGKNRKFTGTNSIRLPNGTTAQRVGSEAGEIRFNTTLNLAEYYTGTEWKAIDAPPVINTISVDGSADAAIGFIVAATGGNATVVIKGSLFDTTGAVVTFVGSSETISTESITRDSSSQLTVTVARASFDNSNEPYAVRVTNGSGLFAELANAIYQDAAPVFTTAADTNVVTLYEDASDPFSETTLAATDADGDTITYSISAGALPPGVTINSSTAALEGTVSGSSIQDYTFTVSAVTTLQTVTRQFVSSVIADPFIRATGGTETQSGDYKVHTFTSPGTFTVTNAGGPTGSNSVEYLIVAGGAAGGQGCGSGGGGAGGYRTNFPSPATGGQPVSATDYPVSVGGGGSGSGDQSSNNVGASGSTSSAFSITSAGGGGGAGNSSTPPTGVAGGSGGGGGHGLGGGGSGNSPPVSPPQGNPGSQSTPQGYTSDDQGGGGGGASQAGIGPTGFGGAGSPNAISGSAVTYAGGGGGGHRDSPNTGLFASGGAGGGGRGGGRGTSAPNCRGRDGTTNTGGGGGGACRIVNSPPSGFGAQGSGGSGIVIVRYKNQ